MKAYSGQSRLLVNGLSSRNQLVVSDDKNPVFSLAAAPSGTDASHMELEVYEENGQLFWNSGKTAVKSVYLQYGGKPLLPKTAYKAKLNLYKGQAVKESLFAEFETGFMGEEWQGEWIEPEQSPVIPEKEIAFHEIFMEGTDDGKVKDRLHPCRELRKIFSCKSLPAKARLYATAHGLYEIKLNGKKVGDALLSPETSPYQKRLYYQTYDVSALLNTGENIMEVLLADGWWAGRIGISGDSCQYGDMLGFLMQLEIKPAGGEKEIICSDEGFECRRSYIDYADLFVGERHDYTRKAEPWRICHKAAGYGTANLVAQPIAPVVEWQRLKPRFFTTAKGELMADFGQVLAGVAELELMLPEAAVITLDFCEVLGRDGNYYKNIIGRNKDQQDIALCPAGHSVFRPKFTYHGFRYVRISGIKQQYICRIEAVAMGTYLESTGQFSCSNEALNRLQQNIQWSTRSNMLSVPTDCPQREKMGWTGDIQIFAKTAAFNYNMANFLEGWLENVRCEQSLEGEIPCVVPCYPIQDKMEREKSGYNSSPAWGDACILVPLYLYQIYGNACVLVDNLPMMEDWLAFIEKTAAQKPENWNEMTKAQKERNPYLWTKGHQFGDWFIPSLRAQGHEGVQAGVQASYRVVGSCFYAITVQAYLEVLQALEKEGLLADKKKIFTYSELLKKIRKAVLEEYIQEDGSISGGLQGLYVLALYAGIGDENLRQKMAEHLVALIEQNKWRLDTGFVSVPYLLDVLCDAGHKNTAYRLLFQDACPSWLYMVKMGATTIWENWEAISPDGGVSDSSFNHYALGCVGDWIYRNIGGVAPGEPGYRKVRFAPMFDVPLENAQACHNSPHGLIISSWHKQNGMVNWKLALPAGVSGEAVVPPSAEQAFILQGFSDMEKQGEALHIKLPEGSYEFIFPLI